MGYLGKCPPFFLFCSRAFLSFPLFFSRFPLFRPCSSIRRQLPLGSSQTWLLQTWLFASFTWRGSFAPFLENENSTRSALHKVFLRSPQVMDVRAFGSRTSAQKTLFSCAPSGESFWAGTSAQISARTSAGHPVPKLHV